MSREQDRERIETYVGATRRPIKLYAKDEDGNNYDMTPFTSGESGTAHLSARKGGEDGDVIINAKAMTVNDTEDSVSYTPIASEVADANAGDLAAQVKLTDSSGLVDYLEPFILRLTKPITGS